MEIFYKAFELGMIYGIVALAVYLTFRVINFPDMTINGSFVLGAAVSSSLLVYYNCHSLTALICATIAGSLAGFITAFLSVQIKIQRLLAGIIVMMGLYSVNFRIMMGIPNISLYGINTIYHYVDHFIESIKTTNSYLCIQHEQYDPCIDDRYSNLLYQDDITNVGPIAIIINVLQKIASYIIIYIPESILSVILTFLLTLIIIVPLALFLTSEIGLGIRVSGQNSKFAEAYGVSNNITIYTTLVISNALVGFAGALFSQLQGFTDINMGNSMLIIGLASVIIGERIIHSRRMILNILSCIVGAIAYNCIIAIALNASDFGFKSSDIYLATSVIIVAIMLTKKYNVTLDKNNR